MARGLKSRIKKVEGLYYPFGENKGADRLRGYRKADLRLCFRICKKTVFSRRGSNNYNIQLLPLNEAGNIARGQKLEGNITCRAWADPEGG